MEEKNKEALDYSLNFNEKWVPSLMLFVATITLIFNVSIFQKNVEINNNLNRPYIEIDTSRLKELDIFTSNPEEAIERFEKNLPTPFINYLDFSIKNVGKLPAKYSVDVSEFKENGLIEIIPQTNDRGKGFIFPGQTIPISYYIKGATGGENYEEELGKELKRTQSLLAGDYTDASKIKVLYGYINDNEEDFKFKTTVEERLIEKGGDIPSETFQMIMVGYSREWFVVDTK